MNLYLEKTGVADHHLSRTVLREFLNEQILQRNIIWEDLYRSLYSQLRDCALRLGLATTEDIGETAYAERGVILDPELAAALRVLEMPTNRIPDRDALKKNYRELLKQFHPDVNPEGQARTRDLIAAYSLVVSQLGLAA